VLGEAHLQTIETKFVLAGLYHSMGEHELANPLHAVCLAGDLFTSCYFSPVLRMLCTSNTLVHLSRLLIHQLSLVNRLLFVCWLVGLLLLLLLGRRERLGDYHEITLHTLLASAHALGTSARARDRALAIPLYEEYLLEAGNKLRAAPPVDHYSQSHNTHNNNDNNSSNNNNNNNNSDPTDLRYLYFSLAPWSIYDPAHALRVAVEHCEVTLKTLKKTLAGD